MNKQEYLECGRIVGTHGVRGKVKIESWCDSPQVLAGLPAVYLHAPDGTYAPLPLREPRPHGGQVVAGFDGVETPEAALLLRGQVVYARREDIPIPEGELLLADLAGLPVLDADTGAAYGTLLRVEFSPASVLYVVGTPGGKEVLLPAAGPFIIRKEAGVGIFIRPIPGFFDEI